MTNPDRTTHAKRQSRGVWNARLASVAGAAWPAGMNGHSYPWSLRPFSLAIR